MSSRGKKKRAKENNLVCKEYFYLSLKDIYNEKSEDEFDDLVIEILGNSCELDDTIIGLVYSSIKAFCEVYSKGWKSVFLAALKRFKVMYLNEIEEFNVESEDVYIKWLNFLAFYLVFNCKDILSRESKENQKDLENLINIKNGILFNQLEREYTRLLKKAGLYVVD